ncbi:dihydroorotase [Sulfurimonas diazotrophicus]|uniref:Dihydroorotase n=1 Tax=Sulfurimonas diazotrophicus TaxID=3131939 RepID=A0ABZ3H8R0_9BACT
MIFENVTICDCDGERVASVRIEEGRITEIAEQIAGDERVDATGKVLLPALVDTNVRLKDGRLTGRHLAELAKAAREGGVGTAVLSPDSTPSVNDAISLEFVQNQRDGCEGARIETTIAATIDDERFSNIAILLKRGAVAPYMTTSISNHLAVRVAEYVKMFGGTLFCRAYDRNLSSNGVMNEGAVAQRLGLVGIPSLGEPVHVARMIEIAREFGIAIVFKSIASPRSLEMISAAKREGVDVRCEVSLHHLLKSDAACEDFNTVAKLDPPLQSEADVTKLREAFEAGAVDMLTLLHQPNSPVNKEVAYADAAYGCESIADALPLLYTKLVASGWIGWERLIALCVREPARTIGRDAGTVGVGSTDLVLFDPRPVRMLENRQSLYNGETLHGTVEKLFTIS